MPPWKWRYAKFEHRALWVREWVVYRRKMCRWPWKQIADEFDISVTTAQTIYHEHLGEDAYTGPLPEWVEPDNLCEVCRKPLDAKV